MSAQLPLDSSSVCLSEAAQNPRQPSAVATTLPTTILQTILSSRKIAGPHFCGSNGGSDTRNGCRCVGGVESHPLQKRQRMEHPQDGEFEKKREIVGHLSSRHGSAGSEGVPGYHYPEAS